MTENRGSQTLPVKIENKRQMAELLREGVFGNTTQIWPSLDAFVRDLDTRTVLDPFPKHVGLRSYNPQQPMFPFLTWEEAVHRYWTQPDATYRDYYVQEVADPSHIVIAGELMRGMRGLELRYSLVKKPMRDAFAEKDYHAKGLLARLVLDLYAEPEDVEHLMFLLDTYSDHVVEFTCFDLALGHLQRRMIIWEVRAY